MSNIDKCQNPLGLLEIEYPVNEQYCEVTAVPGAILQDDLVALWAHSRSGDRYIAMRLPGLRRFLERLAAQGMGYSMEYDGVVFKFMERKFPAKFIQMQRNLIAIPLPCRVSDKVVGWGSQAFNTALYLLHLPKGSGSLLNLPLY